MSAASSPRLGPTDATTLAGPSRLSAATPGSRELSRTASRGASILEDGSIVRGRAESDGGAKKKSEKKLGMFKGVLVPTCENMWGVIIFLRFYKIVGYGGLGYALLIVVLSFLVALLTSLSLSAIATCGTSHSLAGVYPMLSRALGKEIATATGIVYFLGIVFLAVLECLGACEELFAINPCLNSSEHSVRIWGSIFMAALVALVAGGIKLVSHLGLVFFLIVIVTMLSFYVSLFGAPTLEALDAGPHSMECITDAGVTIGGELVTNGSSGSDGSDASHGSVGPISVTGLSVETIRANWGPAFTETMGFSQCLALFFPCFTGILSGANRASSLRDPVTALPYGTLGAITISLVMYSSYIVLWGAVGDRAFLTMDHGQLNYIIWPHIGAAQVGIIVSSLGQALQVRKSAQLSPQFCAIFSRPILPLAAVPRRRAAPVSVDRVRRPPPRADAGVAPHRRRAEARAAGDVHRRRLVRAHRLARRSGAAAVDVLPDVLRVHEPQLLRARHPQGPPLAAEVAVVPLVRRPRRLPAVHLAHVHHRLAVRHHRVGDDDRRRHADDLHQRADRLGLGEGPAASTSLLTPTSTPPPPPLQALHGLRFQLAIRQLLAIDFTQHLDANWKPQLLLLYQLREFVHDAEEADEEKGGGPSSSRAQGALVAGHTHDLMFSMANQLRHGSGLVIAAAIMEREAGGDEVEAMEEAERERAAMDARMKEMAVNGFAMTVTCTDANDGKRNAIQCAGLGPLTPNTILMGWPWWWSANPKTYVPEFLTVMQQATMRHKAVLLYHNMKDFPLEADGAQEGYIDVWWIKHDGGLLLLISHLLQKHRLWKKCLLRLHLIIESGTDPQLVRERVHKLLTRINIKATVEEVILVDSSSLLPYMQVTGCHCHLHLLHRHLHLLHHRHLHTSPPPPPSPLQSSDIRQEAEAHILQEVKHKSAAELAAEELMMHPTNVPDRRSDMDETRPHRGGSVDRNLDRLGGSVDGTPTTARRELVKELNASGVELTSGPPGVSLPQAAAEEEGRQGNGGRRASLRPLSEGTYKVVPAPAAAKAPSTAAAAPPKRPPTIEVAAAVKTEKAGDATRSAWATSSSRSSASRKGSRVQFVTARRQGRRGGGAGGGGARRQRGRRRRRRHWPWPSR